MLKVDRETEREALMEKRKITISVLCMSAVLLSYMTFVPLLAEIDKAFHNVTLTQIQLIFTIPSVVTIPSMLLSGRLVYYFSKKTMVLASMSLIVASGTLPAIVHNSLIFLYMVSGLMGVGLGIIATLSSNIVSDYFEGPMCSKIMGYQSAAISLGGMIVSVLSGRMAVFHWYASYLIFLLFIPCIVIVYKFLPNDVPLKRTEKSGTALDRRLLYFAFLTFLCGVFVTGYNTNIALFIQNKGFGGSETSGLISSLFMLIGIPSGLFVGRLSRALGRNIFFSAVACIAAGFFLTAASSGTLMIYIGALLIGFGFAVRNPSAITHAIQMVPAAHSAMAIAIVGAALSIGNFVSPFVINTIIGFIGNSTSSVFYTCGSCSVVIAVLYLLTIPSQQNE